LIAELFVEAGNGEWGIGNGEQARSNKGVLSFLSASAGYAKKKSNMNPILLHVNRLKSSTNES